MFEKLRGLRSQYQAKVYAIGAEIEASVKSSRADRGEGPEIDTRAIVDGVAAIASKSAVAYVSGFLSLLVYGVGLGAVSYFFLVAAPWYWSLGAALVALTEAVVAAHLLGSKRATVAGIVHGLGTLRLGRTFVDRLFDRMLGDAETARVGERGGQLAQALERLPLGRVEELLSVAVRRLMGDLENKNWIQRKIQTRLLEAIRKYTLARFRAEEAKHGGVDLRKVQAEIAVAIDDAIVEHVRGGSRAATVGTALGLLLLVVLQIVGVLMFLRPPS